MFSLNTRTVARPTACFLSTVHLNNDPIASVLNDGLSIARDDDEILCGLSSSLHVIITFNSP
jgi:hypothetical protein